MAGFLAALGGAMTGLGTGLVENARAKREAAIENMRMQMQMQRDQADRDFRAGEGEKDRAARMSESASDREFRMQEAEKQRAFDAGQADKRYEYEREGRGDLVRLADGTYGVRVGDTVRPLKGADGAVPELKTESWRTLTGEEKTALGLDPTKDLQMGPDGEIKQIGGGGTTVNINDKAEGAFKTEIAKKQAATFDAMSTEGMNARADLAIIGELDGLLKGQGGVFTGLAGWAAAKGLTLGNDLSDLQAAQALISKLVPTQRQAGSGTMSDRDVELFKSSLPSLWNQPGGNEKILRVMKGMALYKQQQGEIADLVIAGELSPQDARKALNALPNPLAEFSDKKDASRSSGPQPGAIEDGYRFKGGNPADPNNWEAVN